MKKMLTQLKTDQTNANIIKEMDPNIFSEFTSIVGLPELQAREAKFHTYDYR